MAREIKLAPTDRAVANDGAKRSDQRAQTICTRGVNHRSAAIPVAEFDQGNVDAHAALLLHLAAHAPLALAVHSGIKSIHGWFYCLGQPEEKLRRFMRYAVSLGACTSTWSRSQFVRMPDGLRDNGKRQVVYYFNPGVIK